MNRTKIEFCDFSANPICGCLHGCPYCYARAITTRFKRLFPDGFNPYFRPTQLRKIMRRKKPARIFMGSMGDIFGEWVPSEWLGEIFEVVNRKPEHTFIFITKGQKFRGMTFPDNCWIGMSTDGLGYDRLQALNDCTATVKFLIVEPLMSPPTLKLTELDIQWLVIGGLTGRKKFKPEREWIDGLVAQADALGIPVFIKNNIREKYYADYPARQEYPQALTDQPRAVGE